MTLFRASLVLTLLILAPSSQGDVLLPTGPGSSGQFSWLWVVPRLEFNAGGELTLSAYYSGLGTLELDVALLDREADVVVLTSWVLVAGHPTDYRLDGPGPVPPGTPLTLIISGLEAEPQSLALGLSGQQAGCCGKELPGTWLRGDVSWIPGLKTGH